MAVALLGTVATLVASCTQPTLPGIDLPGAEAMPPATRRALAEAWQARDRGAKPRTRHLLDDGSPKYTNRLLLETSPYLRQHAHNPVNWYPWGDEAFERARALGRPVLLSVGYSTCHWCHVMEEESFEDEEIARVLNERYVAIKVDREQRPDVDSIYMTAVQAMTGRGGWPMTVWLTPDREPFYGGTYFPARDGDRGLSRGFLTLLTTLADEWTTSGDELARRAASLRERIERSLVPAGSFGGGSPDGAAIREAALAASLQRFDAVNGGTNGAPKFPSSLPLRALLRTHRRTGSEDALRVVTTTLDRMAAGGIHDHLGGGFHRYSVDAAWRVPHFEKMLYDNALLAMLYTEAWQATGRPLYQQVVRGILGWAAREMTSPAGGFCSATDADSPSPSGERVEGWFFTWTPQETAAVLGERSRAFDAAFGVTAGGDVDGRSVLHLSADGAVAGPDDFAADREALLAARSRRPPPLRDDKILTSWNALMISAAARAALAFGDGAYLAMADAAADDVLRPFERNGRLARSRVGERWQDEAFLDDYAFLIAALLDLYEAGGERRRLDQAIALDRVLEREFEDGAGGFYLTARDAPGLLVREKPISDGAEPSGNSVATLSLLRLAELTTQDRYRERADRALAAIAPVLERAPLAVSEALLAVDFADDAPKEVVLVTDGDRSTLGPMLRVIGRGFVPNRVLLGVVGGGKGRSLLPLEEDKTAIDGKPTAYVCEARVCELPTTDPRVLAAQVLRVRGKATP